MVLKNTVKPGQILLHCCRFPPQEEEEMARHLILSVSGDWMETYLLFSSAPEGSGYVPGLIEKIQLSALDTEEETSNNFYWKIIS